MTYLLCTLVLQSKYPFPSEDIIGSGGPDYSYQNIRTAPPVVPYTQAVEHFDKGRKFFRNQTAYRIFADGHVENFDKTANATDVILYRKRGYLDNWWCYKHVPNVLNGQAQLAMDPESDPYREEDGSILFTPYTQADFLFMPTKYTDQFAKAAALHSKYEVHIEVAYSKIVDIITQKGTNVTARNVQLGTSWLGNYRDDYRFINRVLNEKRNYGFIHPYKIFRHGYEDWGKRFDMIHYS